jgi:hypothetical protein
MPKTMQFRCFGH